MQKSYAITSHLIKLLWKRDVSFLCIVMSWNARSRKTTIVSLCTQFSKPFITIRGLHSNGVRIQESIYFVLYSLNASKWNESTTAELSWISRKLINCTLHDLIKYCYSFLRNFMCQPSSKLPDVGVPTNTSFIHTRKENNINWVVFKFR